MFTFTKKADYALLALSFLATEGVGRLVGPREIARRYEIPAELLAKVMQSLAKNRLAASVPGPTGGYRLDRAASSIAIGDVVEAMDGPLAIAQCWEVTGTAGCAQARHCTLRGPLARIQEEMAHLLRTMTLEDVLTTETLQDLPIRRRVEGAISLTMASSPAR
ncbi:MAG: Rrf2 family transcriptional regulator [Cytophagales bacterium]|nr:Rrf2 family transcriptional regulator [Armatimonadota bacterium]